MIVAKRCRLLLSSFCLSYCNVCERDIPIHHKGARILRTIQSELGQKILSEKPRKSKEANAKLIMKRKMSRREIEDLMGLHRDIFKRVNGSIRRK